MTTLTHDQRAELGVLCVEFELNKLEFDHPLGLLDLLLYCTRNEITPASFPEQDAIDLSPAVSAAALVSIITREAQPL